MANIKISDLTAAASAADANEFEINEAGTSKKVTGSQIKAYVNSADGALASKNTVATADIDNDAVTTAKIAADAIDGTKIADDAIDSEHIAADSIDSEHYAPNSVDATAIADNAVGATQLNVPGNGTAGQFLSSDGDGTFSWGDAGGGASPRIQIFTAPGTWTKPASVSYVEVIVVGGGGGATSGNWNPPGNPGGTSSFGSLVSSTGGNGAPGVGGNSNPGSGTVSAGTTISSGTKIGTESSVFSYTPNISSVGNTWGNNTTYNTGLYGNAGAGSTTYAGGGGGGVAYASYVPVSNPQAVTVGAGGNGSGPQSTRGSMKGAVAVKWWE